MRYVIAIGMFQALVAISLLWTNRLRSSADNLLILLVACIGTHLAIKFFIFTIVDDLEVRAQMNTFVGLCYGPLLYLYTLKTKDSEFIPVSKWFVFIPFLLGSIAYFAVAGVIYFSHNAGYQLLYIYNSCSFWSLLICNLLFTLLSLSHVRSSSAFQVRERSIIIKLVYSSLLLSFLSILFYAITNIAGFQYAILFRSIIYSIFVFQCIVIIRHKYNAFTPGKITEEMGFITIANETNYNQTGIVNAVNQIETPETIVKKSGLSIEQHRLIWQQLEDYQEKHKPFTDSELSLDKFSLATGISKYHISETLNKFARKSFYQYINEYRIQYTTRQMQALIENAIPINILLLAYDAGFKAKSSFNRYFKDIVGLTPSEYLKTVASLEATAPQSQM